MADEERPRASGGLGIVSDVVWAVLDFISSAPMQALETRVHHLMMLLGVPPPYPGIYECLLFAIGGTMAIMLYYLVCGARHVRKRKALMNELREAQHRVDQLQEEITKAEREERASSDGGRPIRVWMDGAFDMMHYGHMNAFRLGREQGTHLIVGVNSSESIKRCKGTSPVMSDKERLETVRACKFVDEVVPECPYVMNQEYLDKVVFGTYKVDVVVHGDDPCLDVNGEDVYRICKEMGKYRTIPRTEGISTTDIVGRLLLMSKAHHYNLQEGELSDAENEGTMASAFDYGPTRRRSRFLTTNNMLRLFSTAHRPAQPAERIVYMDGAFDMFHAGHVNILREARSRGDYLIVGLQSDGIINRSRGLNLPIMNLHERVLSVLGCRYVDDVLIDAPWTITETMIKALNISVVVHGMRDDSELSAEDTYQVPKALGIFETIDSQSTLCVPEIASRIAASEEHFEKKYKKKKQAETEYYAKRYGMDEEAVQEEQDSEPKKIK